MSSRRFAAALPATMLSFDAFDQRAACEHEQLAQLVLKAANSHV
jgi:hypothetical protein